MGLSVKEISDKETWEKFLEECLEKTFLQSWSWGEFQLLQGNRIWRLGIFHNQEIVGLALVVKIEARRASFLFVPHGPVYKKQDSASRYQLLATLLEELKKIAKQEKASFIRFSPIWQRNDANNKTFSGLGFREAPIHMHAEVTWELDIRPDEEDILKRMRKTTRYLIRQAQKNKDIEIVKSHRIGDLEKFNPVFLDTAKRHHFVPFSMKYLQNEFSAFHKDSQIAIFLGKYKGEVVSSAIFVFWQNMAFYHHSGSLPKFSKIPVSYLLQWEAMKEAKILGCEFYNFWGIAPDMKVEEDAKKSKHPWAGLSLFKMGFGGYSKEFVKTQDFVISGIYWINYIIEKIRKIKRRL